MLSLSSTGAQLSCDVHKRYCASSKASVTIPAPKSRRPDELSNNPAVTDTAKRNWQWCRYPVTVEGLCCVWLCAAHKKKDSTSVVRPRARGICLVKDVPRGPSAGGSRSCTRCTTLPYSNRAPTQGERLSKCETHHWESPSKRCVHNHPIKQASMQCGAKVSSTSKQRQH